MLWSSWQWGLGLWLCVCAGVCSSVWGERVLVMPVDGSRWLSMKLLARELAVRGHDVLVLVPETSLRVQDAKKEPYRTETFAVPYSAAELAATTTFDKVFDPSPPLVEIYTSLQQLLSFTNIAVRGCEALLYNTQLMERLRSQDFQVMLTDPFLPCGPIIADALALPVVHFMWALPCGLDLLALQSPSPPSYVPRFGSGSTDHMGFLERVNNFVTNIVDLPLCNVIYGNYDELAARYLERQVTYLELLSQGAIWLVRYDFTFEYPRPLMPNMVLIGGINCVKPNHLSEELERFVEGSGEHGIVVFTLGSMVPSMPAEKAAIFFSAFSKIPQRVLWRYSGPIPDNIPENVKVTEWLPQNDLLAHPKARAFITHGGSHGIYEGICNGVPMVVMPLFAEQPDNAHRITSRGAAVTLSIFDVTAETLVSALEKVINNSSYKEKVQELSAIHKDRPMEPLDLAVYWTEFVIRHKGAGHLRPAAHHLNWIQYHCLDVIGFLLVVVATVVLVMIKCGTLCLQRCCRGSQKTKVH